MVETLNYHMRKQHTCSKWAQQTIAYRLLPPPFDERATLAQEFNRMVSPTKHTNRVMSKGTKWPPGNWSLGALWYVSKGVRDPERPPDKHQWRGLLPMRWEHTGGGGHGDSQINLKDNNVLTPEGPTSSVALVPEPSLSALCIVRALPWDPPIEWTT